jgi:hypothetical protein
MRRLAGQAQAQPGLAVVPGSLLSRRAIWLPASVQRRRRSSSRRRCCRRPQLGEAVEQLAGLADELGRVLGVEQVGQGLAVVFLGQFFGRGFVGSL